MNPITRYKRNILKSWRAASAEDVREGAAWYPRAQAIAREVGKGNVTMGAGVIAAFSPMIKWSLNIEMARNAIESEKFIGHFHANNLKARRIYYGEDPLAVLGGNKVRAFYQSIVSGGQYGAPVVDRHALAVALGHTLSDKERKPYLTGSRYDAVARAYVEVATELQVPVSLLQASVWTYWRRQKGMED